MPSHSERQVGYQACTYCSVEYPVPVEFHHTEDECVAAQAPGLRSSREFMHTANGRTWRLYGCAKRGCDRINTDYESFGTREGKGYCLDHIPLRSRVRLWWQERRNG